MICGYIMRDNSYDRGANVKLLIVQYNRGVEGSTNAMSGT